MKPETTIPTFNLLSIGQRGAGKTVFLAGSYAELHPYSNQYIKPQEKLWFDCQNSQVQENIDKILSYVAQVGMYPPSTLNKNVERSPHPNLCYGWGERNQI